MSIKPVVMQTLNTLPFFSELLWMFWEIITHEQNYTETCAAKLTAKMFMDRGSGLEGL